VQVQGEAAPSQIVEAIEQFDAQAMPPDVLVIIRGGGSAEDLSAFNTEKVTRAVAASRVPTLVAIGHEVDLSLAELAADRRASTPSNAAELLVPDRIHAQTALAATANHLQQNIKQHLAFVNNQLSNQAISLEQSLAQVLARASNDLKSRSQLLEALNPEAVLRRGYAIVRKQGKPIRSRQILKAGDIVDVQVSDGGFQAAVSNTDNQSHA